MDNLKRTPSCAPLLGEAKWACPLGCEKMKELGLVKEKFPVSGDFLTTVTINTFRPQYYFEKRQAVESAVQVHKKYRDDPEKYLEYVEKILPLMLDSHKILSAVNLFDMFPDSNETVIKILSQTRPDHIPDFWLTILNYHKELGLKKQSLGSRGRKLVWKFLKHVEGERGLKTIALWFMKNKKKWNEVVYRTHARFKGDMELLAAGILFNRKGKLEQVKDERVRAYMEDLSDIKNKASKRILELSDIKESNLPFLVLEGLASSSMDTTSLSFYEASFRKMTHHEVLRRTGAMLRNGFLDSHHDEWVERLKRAAKIIDPVEIGSVMLQHPEIADDMRDPLVTSLGHAPLNFPKNSIVLCDASGSMKLKKTNARVRVIWELVGLVAASQGIPTFFVRDEVEKAGTVTEGWGIAREFGNNEAYNPTNLSRGLEEAGKLSPRYIFLISDCQTNIPYRGHEKTVAKRLKATIVTMNPTVNPLEPEAATRLNVPNEVFLPIRDLGFLSKVMEVVQ